MRQTLLALLVTVGLVLTGASTYAEETTMLFDFEDGLQGWDIPDWAYEKPDHVQKKVESSGDYATSGIKSLRMDVDFPGGRWTGAIVEIMQYFDWSDYTGVACDIYLPKEAQPGLRAKIVLTVGDSWKWVEMSRSFALIPGQWVAVSANFADGSIDWRKAEVNKEFRQDVRKIDIRVESNNKPAYTGPIYIDSVRITK